MGPSCSMHNPWSVDPDPRGVVRLEARLKAEPASNHDHRAPAQAAVRGQGVGVDLVAQAPGCATKIPADSLLRGPVFTALT